MASRRGCAMIIPDAAAPQQEGLIGAASVDAMVRASAHRVYLGDVQRVLALFTQGIAGQYLHLRPVAAAAQETDGGLNAIGATTDGTAIYLPAAVDSFDSTRHNFGVYRVAILHQIGFFQFGTLGFTLERARERIADLPSEPAWSGPERPALARFFSLWPAPDVMRRIFIALEDLRVDLNVRQRYPGVRADLERTLAHALATRDPLEGLNPVAALWERLLRFTLGAASAELAQGLGSDAQHERLLRMLDAAQAVARPGARVYDSARAAIVCYRAILEAGQEALGGRHEEELAIEDEQEAGTGARSGDSGTEANLPSDEDAFEEAGMGASQIDFRGELNPEFIDEELIGGIVGALDDADEDAGPPRKPAPENAERSLRRATAGFVAANEEHGEARSFLYDEWDYHSASYIKGWCRLFEMRLAGEDFDFIREVHRQHATLAHQVKRRFKFIKPESLRRVRNVPDGEELELDSAIEAIIDRRAGHVTDDRVYSRRDRALREVAAAFLLDMSASTDYAIPGRDVPAPRAPEDDEDYPMHLFDTGRNDAPLPPPEEKRRVIDVARESLALMCEALGTLGDSHAIYGFSGQGRDNVEFYVAKEFEDKLNARTWAALAEMKAQRSTRMGPAIRHALAKLGRQSARMKVLVVVSDGYPQDFDYGPDRTDDEYGIQDTARALQEAEAQGVHTFCITIDPSGHDYLRRMCPDHHYLVIDDVHDLPQELSKVYRALTV